MWKRAVKDASHIDCGSCKGTLLWNHVSIFRVLGHAQALQLPQIYPFCRLLPPLSLSREILALIHCCSCFRLTVIQGVYDLTSVVIVQVTCNTQHRFMIWSDSIYNRLKYGHMEQPSDFALWLYKIFTCLIFSQWIGEIWIILNCPKKRCFSSLNCLSISLHFQTIILSLFSCSYDVSFSLL